MAHDTYRKQDENFVHKEIMSSDVQYELSDEAAHRGALILEEERQMSYLRTAKLYWRPLLFCKDPNLVQQVWQFLFLTFSRFRLVHSGYDVRI